MKIYKLVLLLAIAHLSVQAKASDFDYLIGKKVPPLPSECKEGGGGILLELNEKNWGTKLQIARRKI